MDEVMTADATCIVRVWVEPGDHVIRGRVQTVPGDVTVVARGVQQLTAAVQGQLASLERALAGQIDGP